MKFLDATLTPSQVGSLLENTPDALRQWRHLGVLDSVGTIKINGRWAYSTKDVLVCLVAMAFRSELGIDLRKGVEFASRHAATIMIDLQYDGNTVLTYGYGGLRMCVKTAEILASLDDDAREFLLACEPLKIPAYA